jgi:hypothetical protein
MSRWSMRSRARRKAPLFADGSVERLTKEIRVAGMASGFLDEVEQDPTEGEVAPVRPRVCREFVKARCRRDDPAAPVAGVAVALAQILGDKFGRRPELPVGIGVPVHTDPRRPLGPSEETHLHPCLLDQRQVIEQASESQFRRRVCSDQLLRAETLGFAQHRLALIVEVLAEQRTF